MRRLLVSATAIALMMGGAALAEGVGAPSASTSASGSAGGEATSKLSSGVTIPGLGEIKIPGTPGIHMGGQAVGTGQSSASMGTAGTSGPGAGHGPGGAGGNVLNDSIGKGHGANVRSGAEVSVPSADIGVGGRALQ